MLFPIFFMKHSCSNRPLAARWGQMGDGSSARPPFAPPGEGGLESAHVCSQADVMLRDRLRAP